MLITMPKTFDTKTIIVNLLKEDKKTYLSIERLQELLEYIYIELRRQAKLDSYQISFDINFGAIRRTVMYNSNIFSLDIDGENIYLQESQSINELADVYRVDDTIQSIIRKFAAA